MEFISRNNALGIAQRTLKNLEYLHDKKAHGDNVHIVTHVVNSLLGLVVLPWEKKLQDDVKKTKLKDLYDDGWPEWDILLDKPTGKHTETQTLGDLIWHLRNAAAHGRIHFSSESRKLSELVLTVEDAKGEKSPVNWRARIGGEDLYLFCQRFARNIDGAIG